MNSKPPSIPKPDRLRFRMRESVVFLNTIVNFGDTERRRVGEVETDAWLYVVEPGAGDNA
ncbi:MAG: hypothetical protein IPP19_13755 [Verrucomicrobia bacterium]|nr:hypothetical protein [Verrucomicrobiota bacterium]